MSFDLSHPQVAFGRVVADGIPGILARQRADGAILYGKNASHFQQQAIMPLAWCWAGNDLDRRHENSPELLKAITRLGAFLVKSMNAAGEFESGALGNDEKLVDQRLAYAWLEALRILREKRADVDTSAWQQRIEASCRSLISHRLEKLVGLKHFIGRVTDTGMNHVALYLSTVYRAGQVFDNRELRDFVLPIARALAADVHPDGYWDEHNDLQRNCGPTPIYTALTHCAMSLFYEWTGEAVFGQAIGRSTHFHSRFSYPDGVCLDLIDERVRYKNDALVWGLFGFTHSPEGRGMALLCLKNWLEKNSDKNAWSPEYLARHCENSMYWHSGPVLPPPISKEDHSATLTLPALYMRRSGWALAGSAMRAASSEDSAYRDNPFALDRQRLVSAWHPDVGLVVSGSHSKNQPQAGTFCGLKLTEQFGSFMDYLPCGGSVAQENEALVVNATYRSFRGRVDMRVLGPNALRVDLAVDTSASKGPFAAALVLRQQAQALQTADGRTLPLGAEPVSLSLKELGGAFRYGRVQVKGPPSLRVEWPLLPFNSYASDHKSGLGAAELRLVDELTPQRNTTQIQLEILPA